MHGTTPPVQPSKRCKPSTRFQGRKQKVKPSKPSANQPKNKTLPEVKVDCIKHGKASVESKSMSMQDVDATLKRFDKDYFSGGSNAEDVPDTEEDVEAGIHSVPSKVGEVPVDREGDGETPKTKVVGDTRGEGGKPATVSKNDVKENLAPDGISGDIKGGSDKSKAAGGVKEKKKAEFCCTINCTLKATIWPFPNAQRENRRLMGFCENCNVARKKAENSKVSERRKNHSENSARKALYGWA